MSGAWAGKRWGRNARIALAASFAAVASLAAAASAPAATVFGSNLFGGTPAILACGEPCSVWNTALPSASTAGTLTAPANGVVTSFDVFDGRPATGNTWAPVHLRVTRSDDGGETWSGLGTSSPDVTPTNGGGLQTFPARVPIAAGDYIGLETNGGNSIRAMTQLGGAAIDVINSLDGDLFPKDGSSVAADSNLPGLGVALRATLEPDSDCDGFGDESQDRSPGGSKEACACPPEKATIVGTVEDDVLIGTKKRDVIVGLSGADRIKGAGGADVICGSDGADRIAGGQGADSLVGGPHADRIHGGRGRDRCRGGRRALCER